MRVNQLYVFLKVNGLCRVNRKWWNSAKETVSDKASKNQIYVSRLE